MSTAVMAACWPLQMPPTQKAVLISLADNANDHGECWPSIPTIVARTCLGERTVHGAIKWLEAHGALVADRSNGRHTRYTVTPATFQPPQEMRPRSSRTPAGDAVEPPQEMQKPPQQRQSPPQQLRSNRKEPKGTVKATVNSAPALVPDDMFPGVGPQVVRDFKTLRKAKRAPITATAVSGIAREAAKAGLTLESALKMCCERGWTGFKAEWVAGPGKGSGESGSRQRRQL